MVQCDNYVWFATGIILNINVLKWSDRTVLGWVKRPWFMAGDYLISPSEQLYSFKCTQLKRLFLPQRSHKLMYISQSTAIFCTAWLSILNICKERCWGVGIYRSCQKRNSLSLHSLLPIGRHLLYTLFITSLKVKFMHISKPHKTLRTVSHARNTTVLDLMCL